MSAISCSESGGTGKVQDSLEGGERNDSLNRHRRTDDLRCSVSFPDDRLEGSSAGAHKTGDSEGACEGEPGDTTQTFVCTY